MIVSGGTTVTGGPASWGRSAWSPTCWWGMIMKITNSTSRISISGTTFASQSIPPLPPIKPILMSHLAARFGPCERTLTTLRRKSRKLLAGLELGGDQTDLVDAGLFHEIDGAGHVHEQNIVIALDEGDLFGTVLEDLFDARLKRFPCVFLVVDLQVVAHQDLNDYCLVFQFLVHRFFVRRRLWHQGVKSPGSQGRDDHENDDENQQNIDHRHDIRRCNLTTATSYVHSHCEFSCRAMRP